jgi:hypothetical protein
MNFRILKEGVDQNAHFFGGKCSRLALFGSQTGSVFLVESLPLCTQHSHPLIRKTL